tara:strand:+ start:391 stop:783 length:393 start_codon:yes stop_codon:yes gene_type:complete
MKKICIVTSTYNSKITNRIKLLAKSELKKNGIKKIDFINVPGAFEIPVTISKIKNRYDGFVAIGCIIKGETANFDLISKSIIDGIMNLSIQIKKPIGNCILTLFNKKQAINRINRGKEAAKAVIEILKIK